MNESGKQCMLRCIPDEIDLFYFKTCIITHNNNVIEQNIKVSMFDILSVKEPHIVGAGSIKTWYKVALFKAPIWRVFKIYQNGWYEISEQLADMSILLPRLPYFVLCSGKTDDKQILIGVDSV